MMIKPSVLMLTGVDCGIVAVATITGRSYDEVMSIWPGRFHGDISDSYIHHQAAINRLGFRWQLRSFEDVLAGKTSPEKTAILINAQDDPDTLLPEDLTIMHWVVLSRVTDHAVSVHWGNGTVKIFKKQTFTKHLSNPFCVAYEVYPGEANKMPWYKRLYKRITSIIGRVIKRR